MSSLPYSDSEFSSLISELKSEIKELNHEVQHLAQDNGGEITLFSSNLISNSLNNVYIDYKTTNK